ncbi:glycosyltransferase family 39 protein [Kutzneria buriramensis]|uniref:4-amino-4-deoxy-L-arabinose transferase-like glycosyltransferase n=1 Tax=Kutzneria buriramensis TaxID=1045776 RepID=A0A3E0HDD3_9PSEU|nr:glycosyltransferase family 39 protein [Kutzneria buriramensis]REH42814.1 4-amino-4-deoxy-L-arabinose transferase-like glycosyltransferase [Kutzneria buriramensis]
MTARWPRWALGGIIAVAVVLYGWAIGAGGDWGNPYYAAAVRSMSGGLTNFLFGSLDQAGVITVDKPPLALWPQVICTWIFGYHPFAVLLPQVLEGGAAVFLLHRTVRRWAGEPAALIAAAALAVTPITVAINRDNNPDTLMVLFLIAAAWAFTRAVDAEHRTRWMMLSGLFIGLGFTTKMLQAWVVLPAFALAYLVGVRIPWPRKLLDLAAAGVAVIASSLWWVVLVSLWPGAKPFIGSSGTGSVWDLVIGYNGIGRVAGGSDKASEFATILSIVLFGGIPGPTRLFNPLLGGQISWLLPLALLSLVAVIFGRRVGSTAGRAGWWLWGGWLIVAGLVLSFSIGAFHAYYTTMLAPPIAALTGAGLVLLWRWYRRPIGAWWLALPLAATVSAGWAWVLIARDPAWNGWLRYAVAVVAVLAVAVLVVARFARGVPEPVVSQSADSGSDLGESEEAHSAVGASDIPELETARSGHGRLGVAGALLAVATVLLAPAAWSVATAVEPSNSFMGTTNATAGPYVMPPYLVGLGPKAQPSIRRALNPLIGNQATDVTMTAAQRAMLDYAVAHGHTPIAMAVEGGAIVASNYLVLSDAPVVVLGGFEGADPAPTTDELASWVREGRVRFVVSHTAPPSTKIDTGNPASIFASIGGPNEAARITWVQGHCKPVPGLGGDGDALFDCGS